MTREYQWRELKERLKIGDVVVTKFSKHEPYVIFVALGMEFEGLVGITDFMDIGVMTTSEYPRIGEDIRAVVLGFKEHGQQIWLSVKASQLLGK